LFESTLRIDKESGREQSDSDVDQKRRMVWLRSMNPFGFYNRQFKFPERSGEGLNDPLRFGGVLRSFILTNIPIVTSAKPLRLIVEQVSLDTAVLNIWVTVQIHSA
jgi:hypothetical protein